VARGESALTAGLLMAPQGLGASLAMPLAGRLTDTLGGGRVALVGLTILTLGTIPFAFIDASSSYSLLAVLLVVRGFGIGGSMMPAMAAAYATLQGPDVPRATSALNVMQRVGGSIGTALLAVVLQGNIKDQLAGQGSSAGAPAASGTLERLPEDLRQRVAEPLAAAFASTFWWAVGMSVLALVPAAILALTQRRERTREAGAFTEPEQQIA
jgi:MFS family permease